MILHIVADEKFIDSGSYLFEKVCPSENHYIILKKKCQLKYIKNTKVQFIPTSMLFNRIFLKSLNKYDFVVLHYLDIKKKILLLMAHSDIKFVWIGWGGDYYDNYLIKCSSDFLMTKTLSLFNNKTYTLRSLFLLKIEKLIDILFKKYFLRKIDFFAPVLESEYTAMKQKFTFFRASYIDWNYGSYCYDDINNNGLSLQGKNILVGNSATYENNHIEILEQLKKYDLKDSKIILPLNYGDMNYAIAIKNYCKKIDIMDKCIFLDTFILNEQYQEIINSCRVVIMNHIRQQALGTINLALFLGAKVFLNKESPIYSFYKNTKATVYSIEDLDNKYLDSLTFEQKVKNKYIVKNNFGKLCMIKKTKNLVTKIKNGG